MNKAYRLLLALCATAATLSSCSRTNYAFNNSVPAYLGSQPVHSLATTPAPVAQPAPATEAPAPLATSAPEVVAAAPAPKAITRKQQVVAEVTRRVAAAQASATTTPAKHSFAQGLVAKKIAKQLNHQNTTQTAGRVGSALVVLLVGLVVGIIGAAVSSGFIGVVGGVIFIVGIVLLILALLNA